MPSIAELHAACSAYASSGNFDRSYAAFVKATGGAPNLAREDHRMALLKWLNAWGCRQFSLECHALASEELLCWNVEFIDKIPAPSMTLIDLPESSLPDIHDAYNSLCLKTASLRASRRGTFPSSIKFSETGASKILFALRPDIFLPWDRAIRENFIKARPCSSYVNFLWEAKTLALKIKTECERKGISLAALPALLGRPHSSIPKLLDEYNWGVCSAANRNLRKQTRSSER